MNELRERLYLEQYYKNAKRKNQHLYAELISRKINGEKLDFDLLSEVEMIKLYKFEGLVDKQLMNLFGVDGLKIHLKRMEYGILDLVDKMAK